MKVEIWNVGKGIKVATIEDKMVKGFLGKLEDGVYKIVGRNYEYWKVITREGRLYD